MNARLLHQWYRKLQKKKYHEYQTYDYFRGKNLESLFLILVVPEIELENSLLNAPC